jgi:hypothetical protein
MHQVPHSPYLADQLSNAYDSYLAILRETDRKISIELGREDRKWAMKNVCAPCLYKTENEPKLKFEFLATMDGNNSLKLVDSTFRAGSVRNDSRKEDSSRWISPEYVDRFKDEVGKVRPFPYLSSYCDHSSLEQQPTGRASRSASRCGSN